MQLTIDRTKLESIRMFFILGRPRSGTTLLRTLFEAHPNIMTAPECGFIINMEPKYGKIHSWTRELLLEFYEDLQLNPKIRNWDLDKATTLSNLMQCEGENSFQNICKVIYLSYDSVFDCDEVLWIADKNPVYATYAKRLMKIFPHAVFLQITRDPRDNILSIKTFEFEAPIPALLAFRWLNSSSTLFKLRKKLPERFFLIRYEDLASEPEKYFQFMCDFLKIPFNNEVFNFYQKADQRINGKVEAGAMKFHRGLLSPINTGKLGLWKTKLPDRDVRIAETDGHCVPALHTACEILKGFILEYQPVFHPGSFDDGPAAGFVGQILNGYNRFADMLLQFSGTYRFEC